MAVSCLLCVAGYAAAVFAPWPLLSLAGCALCGFSVGILWPGTFLSLIHIYIVPQNRNEKGTDARRAELNAPAARVCFARKKAARYSR